MKSEQVTWQVAYQPQLEQEYLFRSRSRDLRTAMIQLKVKSRKPGIHRREGIGRSIGYRADSYEIAVAHSG